MPPGKARKLAFKPKIIRRPLAERQRIAEEESRKLEQREQERRDNCLNGYHDSHSPASCPFLLCMVCGKPGHLAERCSTVLRARTAAAQDPFIGKPTRSGPRKRPAAERTRFPKRRRWQPMAKPIELAYHCPGMSAADEEAYGAKDESELNYPLRPFYFPHLKSCMTVLLGNLEQDSVSELQSMDYPRLIKACGPLDEIVTDSMAQIEPEVLELQGKLIKPGIFLEAQRKQFSREIPCPNIGGYVDGVTDDRFDDYIRFYVGQSFRLPIRLSTEHAKEIRNGNTRRLHYFVLARGQGHRASHFLRLWSFPNLPEAEPGRNVSAQLSRFELLQNVLEMTFCYAFGSLPSASLAPFFGDAEYTNVGLNNLPPLFQGKDIPAHVRARFLEHHRESKDTDISMFVEVRKQQTREIRNRNRQSTVLLRRDYRQLIESLAGGAGHDPLSFTRFGSPSPPTTLIDLETEIGEFERKVAEGNNLSHETPFSRPSGNLQAKIGIILSSELTGVEYDEHCLSPLQGLSLNEENSLIWTSSFEKIASGPSRFEHKSAQQSLIEQLNFSLIMGSGIRVIVLCGLDVQRTIMPIFVQHLSDPYKLSGPHGVTLRSHDHTVWFLVSGREVCKLFIACPEPLFTSFSRGTSRARQLRDVFGLTSTLVEGNIRHAHWENACFFSALYGQVRREEEGAEPLRADSLGIVFRDWLHYRGFVNDSDLRELERAGETLTIALLQLTAIMSNRSRDRMGKYGPAYRGYRGDYDPASFDAVATLFKKKYEQRLSSIETFYKAFNESPCLDFTDQIQDEDMTYDLASSDKFEESDADSVESDNQADGDDDGDPRQGCEGPQYEWKATRDILNKMLTTGVPLQGYAIKRGKPYRQLSTIRHLIRFTVHPEVGVTFCGKPRFTVRADLTEPGIQHAHCATGNLSGHISSDPCLRLAIQYRLDDNGGLGGESPSWHWAEFKALRSSHQERIFRANTLVELLEHKKAKDLYGVPRRSVQQWFIDAHRAGK